MLSSAKKPSCSFTDELLNALKGVKKDDGLVVVSPDSPEVVPTEFLENFDQLFLASPSSWDSQKFSRLHNLQIKWSFSKFTDPYLGEDQGLEKLTETFPTETLLFCNPVSKLEPDILTSWIHRLNHNMRGRQWVWLQKRISSHHPFRRKSRKSPTHAQSDEELSLHYFSRTADDSHITSLGIPSELLINARFDYLSIEKNEEAGRFHIYELARPAHSTDRSRHLRTVEN